MADAGGISSLVSLGFTELEARVYLHLVSDGPATAYRISTGIGKPVANTYKAVESLERKGAVLVGSGATRIVSAIDPKVVLNALTRQFETERKKAAQLLSEPARPLDGAAIFHISSEEQCLIRVRQMLAAARTLVILKAPLSVRAQLELELNELAPRGAELIAFDGSFIQMVVDAREALLGPVGVYSQHEPVVRAFFEGLIAEEAVAELDARLEEGAGPKRLAKILASRREYPLSP